MQQTVIELHRHPRATLLTLVLVSQQILVSDDIAPVILAGVEHRQQYLTVAPDHRQRLQRLRRQGRDAEHHHPPGQHDRTLFDTQHMLDKTRMDTGAAVTQPLGTDIRQHRPPQRRLPALLVIQWTQALPGQADAVLPGGPVVQPVSPVHLILVKQIRQPLGQLIALAAIRIIRQKALQRGKLGLLRQGWQQPHQPPAQRLLVQR